MLISAYDKTDKLREMRTRGREGVKNPENFAYVLNGSPLMIFPLSFLANYLRRRRRWESVSAPRSADRRVHFLVHS